MLGLVSATLLAIVFFIVSPNNKIEKIKVGLLPHIIPTLPHWIAVEKGFYKEENLEILEYSQRNSSLLVSSMQTGGLDFIAGVATDRVLIAMNAPENPLRAIITSHARITKNNPLSSLIVPINSTIDGLKDLGNKRIATFPGETASTALKYLLKNNNIDIDTIDFKKIPPPLHLKLLASGQIDCSFAYEPLRTDLINLGNYREIFPAVYAYINDPSATGVTLMSEELYREKPELAKKLIRVWDKSLDFIEKHENDAREILRKKLKLKRETAQKSFWIGATKSNENDISIILNTIESYKKMGILSEKFEFNREFLYKK